MLLLDKLAHIKIANRKTIVIILIILFLIFLFEYYSYFFYNQEEIIYFKEDFIEGIDGWICLDSLWEEKKESETGVVTLSRNTYACPSLMYKLSIQQSPPQDYVFHVRANIKSFSNYSVNIMTLILPTSQISIIVNNEGQIGVSQALFEIPKYNQSFGKKLKFGKWNDIYVLVQDKENLVKVYINNNLIINQEFQSDASPVKELWLGAIWLNGGGNYGSPIDIKYTYVTLGNEAILPKTTAYQYFVEELYRLKKFIISL